MKHFLKTSLASTLRVLATFTLRKFQPGVICELVDHHIWYALGYVDALHAAMFGGEVVVTSLRDSHDGTSSLHNEGRAADIRTRHLTADQRAALYAALRHGLDRYGFDTIDEGDHIHVEWDPKPAEPFIGQAKE